MTGQQARHGADFIAFGRHGTLVQHTTALMAHQTDQMQRHAAFVGAAHCLAIHRLTAEEFTIDHCDTARHRIIVVQPLLWPATCISNCLRFTLRKAR